MIKKSLLAAAGLLASAGLMAESHFGVYYVPHTEFDVGTTDFDGDGFGIQAEFDVAASGRISLDFSSVNYDDLSGSSSDPDIDLTQTRLGYNIIIPNNGSKLTKLLRPEVVHLSVDDGNNDESDTGYGLHLGLRYQASTVFSLFGELGYVDVDNAKGPEVNLGVSYKLAKSFGLFARYRGTMLAEDGTDLDISDFRLGAALYF